MPARTFNVSLNDELVEFLENERRSAGYSSASEAVREAIRQWRDRRIAADVAALEKAHAGAWERDTTPGEEAAILRAQRKVRAEMQAGHAAGAPPRRARR